MATLLNKSSWVMIQRSLFKVKSTLKLFADSDAEYVVDFFSRRSKLENSKVISVSSFSGFA